MQALTYFVLFQPPPPPRTILMFRLYCNSGWRGKDVETHTKKRRSKDWSFGHTPSNSSSCLSLSERILWCLLSYRQSFSQNEQPFGTVQWAQLLHKKARDGSVFLYGLSGSAPLAFNKARADRPPTDTCVSCVITSNLNMLRMFYLREHETCGCMSIIYWSTFAKSCFCVLF